MSSVQTTYPGKLIAVEGVDGSGKSTQIYLLKRWLERAGYPVFFTEWNSSPLVYEATRKGKDENLLTPTTYSLIHCTDFCDRYERWILPRLQAGFYVFCDRYIYTAFARDGVRGCNKNWLRTMYQFAHTPDITFFFHLPLPVARERILAGRPTLKFHEAGMDLNLSQDPYTSFAIYQEMIHNHYMEMTDEYGFVLINGDRSVKQIQEEVRICFKERIGFCVGDHAS